MAIELFDKELGYISELDDQPNDVEGLSATELKALFDQAPLEIKNYINGVLIPAIYAEIAAAQLGVDVGQLIDSSKIAPNAVTAEILCKIAGSQAVITQAIRDGAVTESKIAAGAVSADKLAVNAVITAAIANLAVTAAKLANSAVITQKIADGAVVASKISAGAVTTDKLGNLAVETTKIADSAITPEKINPSVLYTTHLTATAALAGGTNSWTVSVPGVKANNTVIVTPAPAYFDTWSNYGIRATAQGENSITFAANANIPSAVQANILILNVR